MAEELASKFKAARQKSKLAGTIRVPRFLLSLSTVKDVRVVCLLSNQKSTRVLQDWPSRPESDKTLLRA